MYRARFKLVLLEREAGRQAAQAEGRSRHARHQAASLQAAAAQLEGEVQEAKQAAAALLAQSQDAEAEHGGHFLLLRDMFRHCCMPCVRFGKSVGLLAEHLRRRWEAAKTEAAALRTTLKALELEGDACERSVLAAAKVRRLPEFHLTCAGQL